jgi:hypothetical protein
MDQGESRRKKPSRWVRMVTKSTITGVLLLVCSFLGCLTGIMAAAFLRNIPGVLLYAYSFFETAPERSFMTKELLISLSDMPPGWVVSNGPVKLKDDISSQDASVIVFQADTNVVRRGAMQRVYRYHSSSGAKRMYEEYVLPGQFGSTPPEWTYQSPVADQSYFACDARQGQPLNCQWSGRYEEYVVVFGSWIIPDRMSLQDMERVIRAIDMRMAQYLGKPYPDVPARP